MTSQQLLCRCTVGVRPCVLRRKESVTVLNLRGGDVAFAYGCITHTFDD